MSSNQRKDATLGMPHGTAQGKLRKSILFHLLVKLKEDVCFKCGKQIEIVGDLSIEHKLPWEGRDAELFWDLNNIAFSHLRCNRPDKPHNLGGWNRIERPAGQNWCRLHKSFLPVENFSKDSSEFNGLRTICKEHQHYYRDKSAAGRNPVDAEGLNPSGA